MAVTRVNVSIPLRTTNENGFFIHRETPQRQLLGYVVQVRVQQPYAYLELQGVPSELAADLLNRVRAIVPWAALRLDFGIRAAGGDLRVTDGAGFDGQFATAYPAHLTPSPIKIGSNHRTEEADACLFSALFEGLSISQGNTSIGIEKSALFAELGIFLIRPHQKTYYLSVPSMPFVCRISVRWFMPWTS